jgi:hypothetical protein
VLLPHFLGIGVPRAATTWLGECLREHPEVYLPGQKELHFFTEHYAKGVAWYASHFRPAPGQRRVGEVTPNYLENAAAVERMARVVPDARLFVSLREPVERAISAFHFFPHFRHMTFGEACRRGSSLIDGGLYARQLRHLFTRFPRKQVKIILYDDVQREPVPVLADLYCFLGVAESFIPPSAQTIYNSAYFPRANGARGSLLGLLGRLVKMTSMGDLLRQALSRRRALRSAEMAAEDLRYLTEAFREDILELQDLIGRDLSAWLRTCRDSAERR